MSTTLFATPESVIVPHFAPAGPTWVERLLEVLHLARKVQACCRERLHCMANVAALRRYADEMREFDPRYAADLSAAADRHDCGV